MTDFELNKALAKKLGINYFGNGLCIDPDGNYFDLPDYCNNWSDLMPLLVENNITMECYHGKFDHCYYTNDDHESLYWNEGDDPQRALVECLLRVLSQCNK